MPIPITANTMWKPSEIAIWVRAANSSVTGGSGTPANQLIASVKGTLALSRNTGPARLLRE
jgi:hypothetical protein